MRKLLVGCVLGMAMLFFACSEADPGSSEEKITNVEKCEGLASIKYPKKAAVYQAAFRSVDMEKLQEILLKGTVTDRDTVCDEDGNKRITISTAYGDYEETLGYGPESGEVFYYIYQDRWDSEYQSETRKYLKDDYNIEASERYFEMTMTFPEKQENSGFCRSAEKKTLEYLKKAGIEDYRIRASAKVPSLMDGSDSCILYMEQMVDKIPVSGVFIPDSGQAMAVVENTNFGFDQEVVQPGGSNRNFLRIQLVGDEMIEMAGYGMVIPEKKMQEKRVISPKQAFEKVEEQYRNRRFDVMPHLELAELQYKTLQWEGDIYLFPVWVFGVVEYDKLYATSFEVPEDLKDDPQLNGDIWHYYLVNAYTGDFLTGAEVK